MYDHRRNAGNYVLAISLIGLGVLILFAQFLRISLWGLGWPLFVLLPGAALLAAGLFGNTSVSGLVIPGCIVTTVGLLLAYTNTFRQWESWAYIWALIAPTSIGAGLMLHGSRQQNAGLVAQGRTMVRVGLIMFVVAALFFELVIGLGGHSIGRYVWPVALILIGVWVLLRPERLACCCKPCAAPPASNQEPFQAPTVGTQKEKE